MSQAVSGSFTTASNPVAGGNSADLVIPSSTTQIKLNITGLDANNTVKTQKRTAPSGAYVDQATYNSDQVNTIVAVAAGEQWRLFHLAAQATKTINYRLSAES